MPVFKKKADIFTPENKKIRIAKTKNNEMMHIKKPSPDDGKQANHFSRSGATL